MSTFDELIQKTILELSQVSGTGVQIYAEDKVANKIQRTFNLVFDKLWWDRYTGWTSSALDGTTGIVTADLTLIVKRFEDIRYLYYDTDRRPMKKLPTNVNPYTISGSRPRFFSRYSNPAKVFQTWPNTAAGTIRINYRTKPDDFASATEVPMDDDVLVLGATFDYLEDDAANPGSIEKYRSMFETRLKQLEMMQTQQPIPLDDRIEETLTEWREA